MDRPIDSVHPESLPYDVAEGTTSVNAGAAQALRAPAYHETIEIKPDAATEPALAAFVRDAGAEPVITSTGLLGLQFPNGGLIVLKGTGSLAAELEHVSDVLDMPSDVLIAVISDLAAGRDGKGPVAGLLPKVEHRGEVADRNDPDLQEPLLSGSSPLPAHGVPSDLQSSESPLSALAPETRRWGRDDLKHGEAGASGRLVTVKTGTAIGHLAGLGDEEIGHRNGEKLVSSDNTILQGPNAGVGSGLDHLWLLGDVEYLRASRDLEQGADVFESDGFRPKIWTPLEPISAFRASEDTPYGGALFDPSRMPLPVISREVSINPLFGTVTLGPDGHFEYTPANGFSGFASFTYSFVDPRTGETVSGKVAITVAAVADPASVSGGAATGEDVAIATPVTVNLNDSDGSEAIEKVVISGLPSGATLDWNTGLPGSVVQQPDGSFIVSGSTVQIQALLLSLQVTPPADYHGRITLDIAVTTIERNVPSNLPGYLDRETVHFAYHIDVEAVADAVTATGDAETTDEDVAVHLANLAATFGDLTDGSESHVVEIRGVDADAKITNSLGVEYPFSISDTGTKTYTLSPSQIGDVYFLPPPDESGTFSGMSIVAIATEGSNGDREIATAPISVLVNPVADPVEITAPTQATDEDTWVTFGDDITFVVNDALTQTITNVTVTGFPPGSTVSYIPLGGGPAVVISLPAGGSVSFAGASEAEIRASLASLSVLPPPNADQNITLSVSATTEDLGGVTDVQTVPMIITVAAVADGTSITGSASGNEDQNISLPITVARVDADGSESYEFARITIPTGGTLIYPGVLPNGISVTQSGDVLTFTPGPTTTAAQFQDFLATGLQVRPPVNSDVNFNVGVEVGTIESTLSGGEVSLLRASDTVQIPVTVYPVVDMPTVSGASTVDEDESVTFGADIIISENDKADGSEAITQIVLGNIPLGAAVTYAAVGGATVTTAVVAGVRTYTISGGTEDDIRDTLATFALTPPLNSDANIAVTVAITKVDQTTSEGEAAATSTATSTHAIAVAAVADGPTLSGSASGNEDQNINMPITVTRIDADGSESYEFARITVPVGVTLVYAAVPPNGIAVSVAGNVVTFAPGAATTAAQFEAFLATGLQVRAPANSDVNFDVGVQVGTIESTLSGGEVSLLRASQSITIPVTVNPVNDAPVISGSSSVNEDGIVNTADQAVTAAVNFGANIGISAPDSTDGSEAITQIVVSGLPVGAVVSYVSVAGVLTTYVVAAGTTSITLNGGSEAEIRAALASMTLLPPPNSDADISLGIAVTKVDQTTSESEAAATLVTNGTHVIRVAAVADVPTGSGSGSGLEDQNIPVSISVGHADNTDGSENIKNVVIGNIPAGFSLSESSVGAGVLTLNGNGTYTVTGPNDAAINDVLANLTLVFAVGGARQHLDTDFPLSVTVTTIESAVGAGQNALPESSATFNVPITVTAVADAVTSSGGSVLQEDTAATIGANIGYTKIDVDGSESVTTVTVTGFPAGTTVTYTDVQGIVQSFVATGSETISLTGGTEAEIRAALNTLNVQAPSHSDQNVTLTVGVTTTDNDGSTNTTTFNHAVVVQAVADAPTGSGSGAGFEDQNIAVSVVVGHPDNLDGTERIKDVVIGAIPSGFTLSELSAGAGVLTLNGNGTYTVTGPTTAAINDVLANLSLVFVPGGARQHLDTDFSLSVRVTSIESAPSEAGAGEVALLEVFTDFLVPVTVSAVADAVTSSGSSTIQEDTAVTIGSNIGYTKIDLDGSESVTTVTVTGLPAGATVSYTDPQGNNLSFVATGSETISLTGGTEAQIRAALNTLSLQAPSHSDQNFTLTVGVTTTDNDGSTQTTTFNHAIVVQAIADTPAVSADAITFNEDTTTTLVIRPDRSADDDNSETLSVRITVPSDGSGPVGTLSGALAGVTFTSLGGGVYTVTAAGAAAAIREGLLDTFLNGGVTFTPRAQWSGVLTGTSGIRVDAISTEGATGGEVAAGSFGGADGTSQTETATTYIAVTVNPINDMPILANTSTIVQENNNSTSTADPDLIIPIGTRLGMSIADTDGSQGLTMTLTGFPTNAQALSFGTSLGGVTTTVNILTGTVTISGANASNVITVLNSLSITLADDADQNFTVAIGGTVTDSNGATVDSDDFSFTHAVTVQAVADLPTVNVGAATKPAVNEDTGYVTYPVTTALNDGDGSEAYQSVVVQFSTVGTGARPEVQFGTTTGVTFDVSVPGQVTLVGAAADINAALLSLQIRPGTDNGENISVTVTATSVELAPAEDNNGATAGLGGGIAGPEISIPTATTVQSFTIPVTPVPEVPTLSISASASGAEDTTFALGGIVVSSGSSDPDGSESRYLEIDTTSYPAGTQFFNGATSVGSVVTPGWLRLTEAQFSALSIRPPLNYSGTISLSVRGTVVDTNASGATTTVVTAAQVLPVTVTPDADGVTTPANSIGVEDNGAVAFGATINSGLAVIDNGSGAGNNAATETISRIVLDFPADSATQTYTITPGTLTGSAQIVFDAALRTYTITSTIITGAADVGALSQADRTQAQADIRATLAGFSVTMGPTHTDLNGIVAVTATTLDVNGGVANTQNNTFNHTVVIRAVADTPTVSVTDPTVATAEDSANIVLTINPGNSADTDNSETLSVRITVPSDGLGPVGTLTGAPPTGVTLTYQGGGVYLVTASGASSAAREGLLDTYMNGGALAFDPRTNWSGSLTGTNGIRIDVISTEGATGSELAPGSFGGSDNTSATETVTDYIDILVSPKADAPTVKGSGSGVEDTLIPVPMSVTLADKDGSETYVVRITGIVPAGTRIYGAGGTEILPDGGGVYTLNPADVSALAVKPPLHFSTALSGDIILTTETVVTDTSAAGTNTTTLTQDIHVTVSGVADTPGMRVVSVTADEDESIALGAAILASAGGNLNNLLVDTDGSEQLSFVIGGLPQGVIPSSSVPGGVIYIGNGVWSISAAALPTLELPPAPNFSGENPYSGVTVRAVTQEIDGDDASSAEWPVTITVNPVINSSTVDGLTNWQMGFTQTEGVSEGGSNISLASAANHSYVDDDGSEQVVSYTFDLSGLLADAGLTARLQALQGPGADLDDLVANYITGSFSYNAAVGTITVLAGNISGVSLAATLFKDSNEDFSIPVTALVRDTAIINGAPVSVDTSETGIFSVDLEGTADVPTAFASSASGNSGTQLAVTLGGVSTDTDAALGRVASEDVYYVVSLLNPGTAPPLGFTNGAGTIVGLANGDGTWILTAAELVNLHVTTPPGVAGIAELRLTSIAVENDGDTNSNSADFTVTVVSQPGTGGTPPLPPVVTIGTTAGNEDGSITLNVTAAPAPGDPSNPSVAVMISNLPAGSTVIGARFNPDTGRWVASAADVNSGAVRIIPPLDFSGTMNITIEAVATNASLQTATTGATTAPIVVDPVADGVVISAVPDIGSEDAAIDLNISLAERDGDGNEVIGGDTYIRLSDGASLLGGYALVAGGDADAVIDGVSLVGWYRVPTADVPTLQIQAANDWHGTVTVDVAAYSVEPVDATPDADNTQLDTASFGVTVQAVADAPVVAAPVSVAGNEDTSIALPGLSAALTDVVATNGAEVLSVKISGVPQGSRFTSGSNNGDGSWTISVADLATLAITPPLNYAGTMTLTLTAIALELANGDEAQTSVNFNVVVAPHADSVEIFAENVTVDATASALLDLNVRMADNTGLLPGEVGAEHIQITFTSVPVGVSFGATAGGSFSNPVAGTWIFTGTQAEASAIAASVDATATGGFSTISLSAVTIDGGNTLASPVTDTFQLGIPQVMTGTIGANTLIGGAGTQLLFGLGGIDALDGGADSDRLTGGQGSDTLTGGGGADVFAYGSGDLGSGVDNVTDFAAGAGGDALDIAALLVGFDPATSILTDYIQVNSAAGNSTIRIDANGGGNSFQDLVILQGVTGLDVNAMRTNGNLIV